MAQLSKPISKGLFGAIALSLTFGAVASGRDLGQQGTSGQVDVADASTAAVNRATKTDRAARMAGPATPTQTVSLRLDDLSNTSVLIRVPMVYETRRGTPASLLMKSGSGTATVACEPSVSVLTEVAKRLQPGRCVT
ncbi:MAG: hypothetical protein ABI192_14870 [Bradyrhizobium sp.]